MCSWEHLKTRVINRSHSHPPSWKQRIMKITLKNQGTNCLQYFTQPETASYLAVTQREMARAIFLIMLFFFTNIPQRQNYTLPTFIMVLPWIENCIWANRLNNCLFLLILLCKKESSFLISRDGPHFPVSLSICIRLLVWHFFSVSSTKF